MALGKLDKGLGGGLVIAEIYRDERPGERVRRFAGDADDLVPSGGEPLGDCETDTLEAPVTRKVR